MSIEKRYIFVKTTGDYDEEDNCPEGTQRLKTGAKDSDGNNIVTCRTDCSGGECSGYPGVSLVQDPNIGGNYRVTVKPPGQDSWPAGTAYLKSSGNDCQVCYFDKGNEVCKDVDKEHNKDQCCTATPGDNDCAYLDENPNAYSYSTIKYIGDTCDQPCAKDDPNCGYRKCSIPITGKKYKCNTMTGSCTEDPNGTYDSLTQCQTACSITPGKKYKCDATTGSCTEDPNGTYDSLSQCQATCKSPSGKAWACLDGVCQNVGAGKGNYNSRTECENDSSTICYTGGDTGGKGENKVIILLSVLAGIILLAIIGMFIYLFVTGKKTEKSGKVGSPRFRFGRK
jgi:hypothetical protein